VKRIWLKLGFGLAAALTLFFVVRAVMFAVFWMDPHRDRHPVEPWMTPRYIVRTYNIPRDALADVLDLHPGDSPKMPLDKLAQERGKDTAAMVSAVQVLVDARSPSLPDEPQPPSPPLVNAPAKP